MKGEREKKRLWAPRTCQLFSNGGGGCGAVLVVCRGTEGASDSSEAIERENERRWELIVAPSFSILPIPLGMQREMEKEAKRRKFHEALLNKFYPSPPKQLQPSHQDQNDTDEEEEPGDLNLVQDDFDDSSAESKSSSDTSQPAPQKMLTRAQRKRLRKKKLKEAALRPRNKIIGPLLPSSEYGAGNIVEDNKTESICNSVGELDAVIDKSGEKRSCATQNKLKHRRKVKRLNQSNVDCLNVGTCHQTHPWDDGSAP
ncbi:hypothetical protein BVC80_1701g44 [Macleaya cordata]|uniref:Uncharacterized protein n=1 Tax=Macleaya cordata TaxID=56857 RepID=A0A200Q608_MACCD|nr:hypothetical protein BVC80_1701g44 [Macleaya cordata]